MSSYSFQGRTRVWTRRDEEENRAIFSTQRQETGVRMPQEFKPVYLANAEYEVEKWSVKQLMRLLRLYGAHRCLWDIRDPDNRNRKLRKAALIDITAAMGGGVQRAQVVQKINVLRGTYRYEKRRIKQRIRKGIGAKTKLKWFALADAFLRQVPRSEKTRRNEDADTDSDLEDTVVFTIDPETLIPLDDELDELDEESQQPQFCDTQNSIKLENEENVAEVVSNLKRSPFTDTEYFDDHLSNVSQDSSAPVVLKKEDFLYPQTPTSNKRPRHKTKNQNWTTKESLHFVRLLREYPLLWSKQINSTGQQQNAAIAKIAELMNMPLKRIEKRVITFRRTCQNEKLKISKDRNYKPDFVWWPEAANFWETCNEQASALSYFVDANAPPPATPKNVKDTEIKCEVEFEVAKLKTENFDLTHTNTPINPIPSVAPPSVSGVTIDEALEALFHNNFSEEIPTENADIQNQTEIKLEVCTDNTMTNLNSALDTSRPSLISSDLSASAPQTKLIWNGLEDDLLEGKWSLKHSVKFLRLYGAHRCLWDLNDPDYRSRELRSAAIRDIAAAMGYGLDADYVAKKIKIFRITYMQHRKRMLAATKLGKEPEIQLRWFPLADSFLRPHIGLRSIKEQEHELPQFDFQYVFANLNLIDPALLTDFQGKGTQNAIEIGDGNAVTQIDEQPAARANVSSGEEVPEQKKYYQMKDN